MARMAEMCGGEPLGRSAHLYPGRCSATVRVEAFSLELPQRMKMKDKRLLRLREWVIESNFAGTMDAKYFFTESDARLHLGQLSKMIPVALDRYPDNEIERYYGYCDGKDYGVEIRQLRGEDAVRRYPRIVAHLICHSLGYCTPRLAGVLLLAAARNLPHYCEWIFSCYRTDPRPAVVGAITGRNRHKGYMADFGQALTIVNRSRSGSPDPLFASWF